MLKPVNSWKQVFAHILNAHILSSLLLDDFSFEICPQIAPLLSEVLRAYVDFFNF